MKLMNPKNPLQNYAEQTSISNSIAKLNITTVEINCPTHGTHEVKAFTFRQNDVNCPICEREKADRQRHQEYRQAKRQKAIDCGIAPRYYDFTLADYQVTTDLQKKLLGFTQAWLSSFTNGGNGSKNLALIGATGTGKTMLASIIANGVFEKGYKVKMLRSSDIAERVRATWKPQSRISGADLMKSWIECDLLVIDEFGEGDIAVNSEWADQDRVRLSKIIDGRYQNGKPTIITSNFDKDRFFGRLGDRAFDRFQENLALVVCNWGSYRQQVSKFMEIMA